MHEAGGWQAWPSGPTTMPRLFHCLRDRPLQSAAIVCGLYALALIWLGICCHPMEILGGESDHYVRRAQQILAGDIPRDEYRPLLYPLLVAAIGGPVGDCFAAGRVVSALSAAALVFCTFGFVRLWSGIGPAWLVVLLLLGNGHLAVHGTQVATDTTFAALAAATLWAAARCAGDPRVRAAALPGCVFALAWFTRYTAVALLVPVAVALILPRRLELRIRAARLACFLATAAACLIPHFILTWMEFGSPVYDRNWRSFAMKAHGEWDARYVLDNQFDGLWSVVAHDPLRILVGGWNDLVSFGADGARTLMQGVHPPGWIGVVCLIACLIGVVRSVVVRRGGVALWFGLAYVLLVCVTFRPHIRLALAVLPVLCGAAATGLVGSMERAGRTTRAIGWIAGIALVLAVSAGMPTRLEQFEDQHPQAEVAAAQHLVASRAAPFRLLSSYPNMDRHIAYPVDWVPVVRAADRFDPEAYFQRTRETLEATGAQFVILGRCTLGGRLFDALGAHTPSFLRRLDGNDQVALYEAVGLAPAWIAGMSVEPNIPAGGPLRIEVRLLDGEHVDRLAQVVVAVTDASGQMTALTLERTSRLVYRLALEKVPLAPGAYRLTPAAVDRDGRLSQGDGVALTVTH